MAQRTLFSVLEEAATLYNQKPALHQPLGKQGNGKYRTYAWTEYRDLAKEVACGLRCIGVQKGDIVALYSETRAEFYIADLGVLGNGSISAALYTSLPLADQVRTLAILSPRALIVEDPKSYRALSGAGADVAGMHCILLSGDEPETLSLDALRDKGRAFLSGNPNIWKRMQEEIQPGDPAILYLTSGATGEPKMGLASHASIVANIDMGPSVLPLTPEDSTLAFLPSAHIAQRVVMELLPFRFGASVYFSEGLAKMPNELKTIKPTFLLAPPRVWERIYASVQTEVKKKSGIAQRLFYTALGLGVRAGRLRREGKSLPAWMSRILAAADKLMFQKVRERLGGRIRYAVSGAAPLGKDLALFFEAIGLPLIEGYGLTEGGVVCLNPIARPKPGSIGKALPGVEMKTAEDGELLIKSPSLFSGYYRDPAATTAVLRDGWLFTGDVAEIDSEGYVFVTGRKKELIVSSNGKKIYPARIEGLFKMEPLVSQVLLIGDRQPYVTALITINRAAAEALAGMQAFKDAPAAEFASAPPLIARVDEMVRKINKQLAGFEHIKRFRILEQDFSIERGEMTPTMKVRRKQVLENYRDIVTQLYLGKEEMA